MNEMISFGGGVNTIAMTIILCEEGWRGPIVFADTMAEKPETYCYMDYFERDFLKPRNLEITRLLPGSEYHDHGTQEALESYCLRIKIIPLLTVRWCSIRWKRRPILAYREKHGIVRDLLGISADEPGRVRYNDESKVYPLVERGINRDECRRIIRHAGLEIPPRSSCFFCPGQTIGEWRELYYNHPDLYERACMMEDTATSNRKTNLIAYLRPSGPPLRELAASRWQGQERMDLSRWLPCACTL